MIRSELCALVHGSVVWDIRTRERDGNIGKKVAELAKLNRWDEMKQNAKDLLRCFVRPRGRPKGSGASLQAIKDRVKAMRKDSATIGTIMRVTGLSKQGVYNILNREV